MPNACFRLPIITTLVILTARLGAHSDPPGYVHPCVCVENGEFVIYTHRNSGTLGKLLWRRTCYSVSGSLISSADEIPAPKNEVVQRCQPLPSGEKLTLTQQLDVQGKPNPHPGFHFDGLEAGQWFHKRLPLEAEDAVSLEAALITDGGLGLAWGAPSSAVDRRRFIELHFAWIKRPGYELLKQVNFGPCASIYDFVRVSNLIKSGNDVWLAYVAESIAWEEEPEWKTVLASVDANTGTVKQKELKPQSSWNTSLSLNVCEGWLCVAWHCASAGSNGIENLMVHFEPLLASK
jgi:hypothetical protein